MCVPTQTYIHRQLSELLCHCTQYMHFPETQSARPHTRPKGYQHRIPTCLMAMETRMELTEPSICTRSFSLRLTITGVSSNSLLLLSGLGGGRRGGGVGGRRGGGGISKQMTKKTQRLALYSWEWPVCIHPFIPIS